MNENDFVVGVLTYITCLREKKRYSTAKSYQDALRSFKCFVAGKRFLMRILIGIHFCVINLGCWPRDVLVTRYLLICAGFVTSII
mgnify:FL=1